MKAKMSLMLVLLGAFTLAAGAGCQTSRDGRSEDPNVGDLIREITYVFGDAPIPPEYHRSYTITVTADTVRVVIDSYGEVLADEQYEVTEAQFDDLRDSLEANSIRNCTLGDDEDCVGGNREEISYSGEDTELFSGTVYHCGGVDSGDLCGDVAAFADEVKALVPDFEDLLQSTQEQEQ